jgi:type IX secretion system PorP/SprF family membrane protein
MKSLFTATLVLLSVTAQAQLRPNFSQYMLNQGVINPGHVDIETRFGGIVSARKQWMTMSGTPFTVFANGHYRLTRNHAVGTTISNDNINEVNTLDISACYTYQAWLTSKLSLGLGIKAGFQQLSVNGDYVYFDHPSGGTDPTLDYRKSGGLNLGAGLSLQSQNLLVGFSMPYIFNNAYSNKKSTIYETEHNHFYTTLGYKIRFNDNFILYPSMLFKGVSGAPLSMSFDGHVLINQRFWFGGGYRSDNTVALSGGVFLEKGLRIIYTYESATFSPHKRMDNTHEISLNYARSIFDSPFQRRQYIKKSGKRYKREQTFKIRRRN